MNKNELVEAVGGRVGDRAMAAAAVDAVLATIVRTVHAGERVALSGFGVFEKADRAARTARNPSTGGTVDLPATSVPRFRAGQAFKDVVSGARSAPEELPALEARPRTRTARSAPAPEQAVLPPAVVSEPEPTPAKKAPAARKATAPAKKAPATPAKAPAAKAPAAKAPAAKAPAAKAPAAKAPAAKAAGTLKDVAKGKDSKGKDAKPKDSKSKDSKSKDAKGKGGKGKKK